MASPPQPQDGQHQDYYYGPCDYASAFRSATNDVFNSVPGLTLFEVAGRHGWALSRHKHDQPQASKHAAFPLKLKESMYSPITKPPPLLFPYTSGMQLSGAQKVPLFCVEGLSSADRRLT